MPIRSCCLVLLSIVLMACQRAPQAPETPTPDVAPAAAPDATAPRPAAPADAAMPGPDDMARPERDTTPVDARVVDVRLSRQGDAEKNTIGMPTTSFASTDTVYAEVETNGTAGSYSLYAKWLAPDGAVLADYGMRINEAGPKRTVISLSKPDGWAVGPGRIELAINGKTERTATFDVR